MNHLLITIGSHGDTHPFIGIGQKLRQRGHNVTLAANGEFGPAIRAAGLEFAELGTAAEFRAALDSPDLWHPTRGFRAVFEIGVLPILRKTYDLIAERYIPGQTIVTAHAIAFGARIAQEKLGVPLVTIQLAPAVFRSGHSPPVFPGNRWMRYLPATMNRALFRLVMDKMVVDPVVAGPLNAFRAELGLRPVKNILDQWWLSPTRVIGLFPNWFAPIQPDWPPQLKLTGFPLFDERGSHDLPIDVQQFLDEGEPPIAFTFGSAMLHAHQHFIASIEACRLMNRRGLLITRFPEQLPGDLPPHVRHLRYAPFSEMLPHCAALVHHGGIGTTAQTLAAGIPQLIVPFFHDQHDNAARIQRLGCGANLSPGRYHPRRIAQCLQALLADSRTIAQCKTTATRIGPSDSMTQTCQWIEEVA